MAKKLKKAVILGFFKEESRERLNILNNDLLRLEKDPSDSEALDEILREVHGLKGAARMVGLGEVVDLTHEFETLFNLVKEGKVDLTKDITNIGFEVFDSIDNIVDSQMVNKKPDVDPDDILERIGLLSSGKTPSPGKKAPAKKKKSSTGRKVSGKKTPKDSGKSSSKPVRKDSKKGSGVAPVEEAETSETSRQDTVDDSEHLSSAQKSSSATKTKSQKKESIRVNIKKIDDLINIMGEVVVNQMLSDSRRIEIKNIELLADVINTNYKFILDEYGDLIDSPVKMQIKENLLKLIDQTDTLYKEYNENTSKMALTTNELQEGILKIRMLPASTLFDTFPRTVRDIAMSQDKEVEFIIRGSETEVDTNMLEELKDPLIHLLRNAIDHGIEIPEVRSELGKPRTGTIILEIYRKGDSIFISIKDDGKGIDPKKLKEAALKKGIIFPEEAKEMSDEEAFNLIFEMGFSTRDEVSDISGRGVGMDVVKKKLQNQLKGEVMIHSVPGAGTEFLLKVPLTLTIIWSLLVKCCNRKFALPVTAVEQIISFTSSDLVYIKNREAIILREEIIPFVRLSEVLNLPEEKSESPRYFGMILRLGTDRLVFQIEEILDELQIVIKTLDEPLKGTRTVAGVTILGTGEVVPVLNVPDLIELARKRPHVAQRVMTKKRKKEDHDTRSISILVAEDSFTTRQLEKSILEGAGYKVDLAVNGVEAWNKLNKHNYDIVITDIEMPDMDGFELTKKIKGDSNLAGIPVIIVTTWDKPEFKTKGLASGADKYILKSSFNQETLLNTIRYLIERQE